VDPAAGSRAARSLFAPKLQIGLPVAAAPGAGKHSEFIPF
jgi:hypothetical protein